MPCKIASFSPTIELLAQIFLSKGRKCNQIILLYETENNLINQAHGILNKYSIVPSELDFNTCLDIE